MTRGIDGPAPTTTTGACSRTASVPSTRRARIDDVDPARVAVGGGSQGGGITIAVAGLVPDVVAALPDVPFLCHYRRATSDHRRASRTGRSRAYLSVFRDRRSSACLAHAVVLRRRELRRAGRAPACSRSALMDTTCPPSTVFAAYNHWQGEKDIRVYRYNQHEGGGSYHTQAKIWFLQELWG